MGMWGAHNEANAQQEAAAHAAQTASGGSNYFATSPIGTQYAPAGGAAINQEAGLLGIGGDPAAAAQGYQNYLSSTGYQGQLQAGTDAINSSAASAGALNSGSTLRALQRYGTQLGQQNFNNYLSQLHGVAGMGLTAGGMVGNAQQDASRQAAQYQYGGDVAAAGMRHEGFDQLAGGIGGAYEAWQNGRGGGAAGKLPAKGGGGNPELTTAINALSGWLKRGH
jgi:hypothetical protein